MSAFKIFKSKKEKKVHQPTVEEYYIKLGSRAKTATVIAAITLALMVIFAFSAYSDELTVDNMRYMLKFINTEHATANENDVIHFDSDIGNKARVLSDSIGVYNPSGIIFYDNTGKKLQTDTFRTDSGVAVVGNKHLFYYDIGGTELRVYTPYQKKLIESFDYPILGLAASDNDRYAVITTEKGYRSTVNVYDANFRVILVRKFGEYYVNSIDISSDGNSVIAAAMYSESGVINAGVYILSVSEKDPVMFESYPGEIAVAVKSIDSGYALLTDKALRFYDHSGKTVSETDISALSTTGFCFGRNCCTLFCNTKGLSSSTDAVCYMPDGGKKFSHTFDSVPIDKAYAPDGSLFVLTHGVLHSFDVAGNHTEASVDPIYRSLVSDGKMLLLFSNDTAVIYKTYGEEE